MIKVSCRECGLFQFCRTPKMQGVGNPQSPFYIVGFSPSSVEDDNKKLLTDKKGTFLKRILNCFNLTEEDYYYTTLIKCYTTKNDRGKFNICMEKFFSFETTYVPKSILILGTITKELLLRDKSKINFERKVIKLNNKYFTFTFTCEEVLGDPHKLIKFVQAIYLALSKCGKFRGTKGLLDEKEEFTRIKLFFNE